MLWCFDEQYVWGGGYIWKFQWMDRMVKLHGDKWVLSRREMCFYTIC
jgi:hypothetical protein